jgi:hypothetical protein
MLLVALPALLPVGGQQEVPFQSQFGRATALQPWPNTFGFVSCCM